jgi:hypothetical protein
MHNISNLFYFRTKLYMFRKVSRSINRTPKLYIQHQVYVIQVLWLLEATEPVWYDAVCTGLDSWWWTERPSETCRLLFQNKINLRYCASGWFYYRNNITMHGPTKVKIVYVKFQSIKVFRLWKHIQHTYDNFNLTSAKHNFIFAYHSLWMVSWF